MCKLHETKDGNCLKATHGTFTLHMTIHMWNAWLFCQGITQFRLRVNVLFSEELKNVSDSPWTLEEP